MIAARTMPIAIQMVWSPFLFGRKGLLQLREFSGDFGGILISSLRVFGKSLVVNLDQLLGDFALFVFGCRRRIGHDGVNGSGRGWASKGVLSGQHFVEDDSERKDIASRGQRECPQLFGRHVGKRA